MNEITNFTHRRNAIIERLRAATADAERELRRHASASAAALPLTLAQRASRVLEARRSRFHSFAGASALFGEPAYDILLDLYLARGRYEISISAACIGSGVPTSTALRAIGLLVDQKLIQRIADPLDGRRHYIRLTAEGTALIEDHLERF